MSLLEVKNLKTYFFTPFGAVKAVDDVSFTMKRGTALGLAGESGCGKTTTAYSLMKLVPLPGRIVDGEIIFNGEDIVPYDNEQIKQLRWKQISMVFQGAMASLNPLYKIGNQIAEPIIFHEKAPRKEAMDRARELLELVGIEQSRVDNYPWELSGGMRQRAMIAMALACYPTLLIADEPTTALDVIVSAQVMDLIKDLRNKLDLSMLEKRQLMGIKGDPSDLIDPPDGCRFSPRCPFSKDICTKIEPALEEVKVNHFVACHFWEDIQLQGVLIE
jgi:peptide/nickel transport system ATP-binding protein